MSENSATEAGRVVSWSVTHKLNGMGKRVAPWETPVNDDISMSSNIKTVFGEKDEVRRWEDFFNL